MVALAQYDESLIAYGRISTDEQTGDLQDDAFERAGVHPELRFWDIESGRKLKRDGLLNALKCCGRGATLVVWKLGRLGRNTAELILTVKRLHERGVKFRSLTQSEISTESMETATGQLVFHIFSALAEFESAQLAERTKAGMRAARDRGAKFGRVRFEDMPKYMAPGGLVEQFQACRREGRSVNECLAKLKIPPPTYKKYRHIFIAEPVDDIGESDE